MNPKGNHGLTAVAKAVGVHSATVVRWLKDGKVPTVKKKKNAQGHWVFTDADIAALRRHRTTIYSID